MERIDLVAGRIEPITAEPLGFNIAVPAIRGDAGIVPGNDVVHTIFKLLPQGAVAGIDTDEPDIRLEPSDPDLMRNQVQAVDRPGVAVVQNAGRVQRKPRSIIAQYRLNSALNVNTPMLFGISFSTNRSTIAPV